MPLQINVNINSGNTSTGGGGGGTRPSSGRNSSIFNGPMGRNFGRFIQLGARFFPLLGLLGGAAGIVGLLSQMIGNSKIASTFASATMKILGAILDMILLPFIPTMVKLLTWLAERIPDAIEWGKALYALTKDVWAQLQPTLQKFWTDIQPVLIGIWEYLKTIKRDWKWDANPNQKDWQQNPAAAGLRAAGSVVGATYGGGAIGQGLNVLTNPDIGEKIKSILRTMFDPLGIGSTVYETFRQGKAIMGWASGTSFVPQNGLAYLHRGEQVISAGDSNVSTIISNNFVVNTNFDSPFHLAYSLGDNVTRGIKGAL
jgi:hypothetical protein